MLAKHVATQSLTIERMTGPNAAKKEFKALQKQFNDENTIKFETVWKSYVQELKYSQARKEASPPTFRKIFCGIFLMAIREKNRPYSDKNTEIDSYYDRNLFLLTPVGNTDLENAKYDKARVAFIINALAFITKHLKSPENVFETLPKLPDIPEVKESLESIWLYELKSKLRMVSRAIGSLSGQFRSEHKNKLPFETDSKWQVLEYFGGFMSEDSGVDSDRDPILQDNEMITFKDDPELRPIIKNWFVHLVQEETKIVEASLPDIVREDVPELRALFSSIYKKDPTPPQIKLTNIQMLTTHLRDDYSLRELLKFSADSKPKEVIEVDEYDTDNTAEISRFESCGFHGLDLDQELDKYAFLRRFQILGELMTGKNMSRHVRGYIEMVDLKRYVDLRDGLSHQDEHGNRAIVDELFSTYKPQMEKLLAETPFLMHAATWVVAKRFCELPRWQKTDVEYIQFWKDLKTHYLSQQEDPSKPRTEFIPEKPLLSPEKITMLCQHVQAPGSETLHSTLKAILEGQASSWPNKQIMGQIQRCFQGAAKKECKKLIKEAETAYKEFRSETIQDKIKKTQQEKLDRAQKKIKQDAIYEVSELFNKGATELSLKERILWIKEILGTTENILCTALDVKTLKEFTKSEDWEDQVAKLVSQNRTLKDAIEYQAGRFLQLLDYIHSKYPGKCIDLPCLSSDYESLRSLRNHIEHGHSLIDTIRTNKSHKISQKDQRVSAAVINLLLRLPEELDTLYQRVTTPTQDSEVEEVSR